MSNMLGAIELGGTKVIAAVANDENQLIDQVRIKTEQPGVVLEQIIAFFKAKQIELNKQIQAIGIASFGPINLDANSDDFGCFFDTPKAGWSRFPLIASLKAEFDVPYRLETDVSGALLAELKYGAAKGCDNAIYVTIGTGVGAGVMANRQLVQGQMHPEVGHMIIPTKREQGSCPFHANCLEGMASGPAIAFHAGAPAQDLASDHPIWDEVSDALAFMCHNLLMTLSTQRIVLGGGVMAQSQLLDAIRAKVRLSLNGYLSSVKSIEDLNGIIVKPGVSSDSGLIGATILAKQALARN